MDVIEHLYEDEAIVVCVKCPGLLSQPDTSGAANMLSLLEEEGRDPVFPVHRLDRNVGGVMVFAKTRQSAAKLSFSVQDKDAFRKEYMAIVEGETQEDGVLHDFLYKNAKEGKAYCVRGMRRGVKEAALDYRRLSQKEENGKIYSLLLVRLHTGRFHQIRVQFASRGLPLAGDGKYGSRDNRCSVALWAAELGFSHPMTGQKMRFVSLPPKKYPWDLFDAAMETWAMEQEEKEKKRV